MKRIIMSIVIVILLTQTAWSAGQSEKEYPSKPIQVVVPYSAGGGTDIFARTVLRYTDLNDDIVVKNIAGGGAKLGTMEVINSKADGYTLLSHVMAIAIGYHAGLYDTPPWEKLDPICSITVEDSGISVKADSPWKTIDDLINYAKENPGKLRLGFAGVGGTTHSVSAIFAMKAGIDVNFTPFKGGADSRVALAGGHIDAISTQVSEVIDLVEAGELRMLVTTGSKRHYLVPNVPTLKESGIDFVFQVWRGFFAPKGTPQNILNTLEKSMENATKNKEFVEVMKKLGYEIEFRGSEKFLDEIKRNHVEFAKISDILKGEK